MVADRTFCITRGKTFFKDFAMLTFLLLKSISCILTVKKMVMKIFCRRNRKGINSNEYCRQKIFKVPCDSQQIDFTDGT